MAKLKKYEFIGGDFSKVIDNIDINYTYIYAPQAEFINARSADVIFCNESTHVAVPCADIRRGNWFLKDACIQSKDDGDFKYKLTFGDYFSKFGTRPRSRSDSLECSNMFCNVAKTAKNIELCEQKIKEGEKVVSGAQNEEIKKALAAFDSATMAALKMHADTEKQILGSKSGVPNENELSLPRLLKRNGKGSR